MTFDDATINLLEKLEDKCRDSYLEFTIQFRAIEDKFSLEIKGNLGTDYFKTEDKSLFWCVESYFRKLAVQVPAV